MAFVAALAHACYVHSDVIRCGVATASNDHRLGAQEAPPAIISLYTGDVMYEKIEDIMNGGELSGYAEEKGKLPTGATATNSIVRNLEDRNRTAPFPFCGAQLCIASHPPQLASQHIQMHWWLPAFMARANVNGNLACRKPLRVSCGGVGSEHCPAAGFFEHRGGRRY